MGISQIFKDHRLLPEETENCIICCKKASEGVQKFQSKPLLYDAVFRKLLTAQSAILCRGKRSDFGRYSGGFPVKTAEVAAGFIPQPLIEGEKPLGGLQHTAGIAPFC